ncbi:helix-turn-helix domain-containing protein [Pseudobutyrivibrio xylanivorans]|uniref:Nucleotidyltransferase domain-containing protein n=1 Tax=Pseudobutyrivibrio xylanivorans TaxID=185007 RepID=A0A1G5RUF2_PSEXY|nr:helix-turn-helix domain-containing protein [Pseudobutyrivibrio xylanivorans]SCZ77724.1 Nucleotidyltransferase domain-containing protein [Pseudobutyrivibrio xylanivorans]
MSVESEFEYEKQQIANLVKRLRAYSQLSQRDLSRITGISQADISKIERGLGNPSINTISRIMSATGASLNVEYKINIDGEDYKAEIWPDLNSHIRTVAKESSDLLVDNIGEEIEKVVLFGSCARGDNTEDSDMDIAALIKCERSELSRFTDIFAQIGADMMDKYQELVNIVGIPIGEYIEKKSWYPFYKNIDDEGIVLYAK